MREVRMTFGEHLEELRRRVIFSLIYLAGGVTLTMTLGTDLVDFVLEPHYTAFTFAQREIRIERMEKALEDLDKYTAVAPTGEDGAGGPAFREDIHWEILFARDVVLEELYARLEAPSIEWAAQLRQLESVSDADRALLVEGLEGWGRDMSRILVEAFSPEVQKKELLDIPERFRRLETRLLDADSGAGGNWFQKYLGWGSGLDGVLGPIRRFNDFLELRREEALETRVSIPELREWLEDTTLARELDDLLDKLEVDARQVVEGTPPRIHVISYIESFSTYLKLALIVGAILALPGILYEMWKFIGAGLYANEQAYVVTILPFSLGMFVVGMAFGYFIMIPVGLAFLAGWGVQSVELTFTLGSYVGLFLTLTLLLGLVFQTPLLMIFFTKIGLTSVNFYRKGRRVAILVGVILAVIFTPPDPFSWSLMAVPMLLLYEVGIIACKLLTRDQPGAAESRT